MGYSKRLQEREETDRSPGPGRPGRRRPDGIRVRRPGATDHRPGDRRHRRRRPEPGRQRLQGRRYRPRRRRRQAARGAHRRGRPGRRGRRHGRRRHRRAGRGRRTVAGRAAVRQARRPAERRMRRHHRLPAGGVGPSHRQDLHAVPRRRTGRGRPPRRVRPGPGVRGGVRRQGQEQPAQPGGHPGLPAGGGHQQAHEPEDAVQLRRRLQGHDRDGRAGQRRRPARSPSAA